MPTERPYSSLSIGDKASLSKTITEADVVLFAGVTGDFNPIHVNEEFAKKGLFGKRIAHLKFVAPVYLGDTITAEVEITNLRDDKKIITLATTVRNQNGETVIEGQAVVKKHEP